MEGDYDPSIVMSDTFWNTSNRVNVINGTSTTIKKNGKYVARLETADGLYVMVPFTVSGVIEKVVVIPTATPVPTQTPASTRTPVTTPQDNHSFHNYHTGEEGLQDQGCQEEADDQGKEIEEDQIHDHKGLCRSGSFKDLQP